MPQAGSCVSPSRDTACRECEWQYQRPPTIPAMGGGMEGDKLVHSTQHTHSLVVRWPGSQLIRHYIRSSTINYCEPGFIGRSELYVVEYEKAKILM